MGKIDQKRIDDLKQEIAMAEAINMEELRPIMLESFQRYTGDFIPIYGNNWDIILNEVYPVIQNQLPAIFFRTPRAFLKPRNKTFISKVRDPISGDKIEIERDSMKAARTQEAILNYSLQEMKYKKEAQRLLLDALLFPHGVLWHGYKGDFGMTEERSITIKDEKTFVKRLNPMHFIKDPAVSFDNIDEGEWVGRIFIERRRDIIEDDLLDVDKKQIKGFKGYGERIGTASALAKVQKANDITDVHKKSLIEYADDGFKNSESSKFVKLYEVFLRPTKKEKRNGIKGWILLLCNEQDKPLRVSEWKIKAEGFPAKLLQFNPLPDSLFGLHDTKIYSSIADQKNIIINLQLRNAQENSKTWVGISKAGADEEDINKIRSGENTIVLFDDGNPRERMFVASAGGQASSELYIIDQRIQKNLEDKSGVSDLKRGFLQSGEESAASVKLRAAGSSARPAYRQDIMKDFLQESFHYLNQLNKQFMPYRDAVRIIGSLDLEWSESPTLEDIQSDTDVEIDAISMLPENPDDELRNLNQTLGLMIQSISSPVITNKLAQEGKTLTLSPIIEQILVRQKIKNPDVFRNIKPEESQGFVSVAEVRAAKTNVEAALAGSLDIPSPPALGQDHLARLEVYSTIFNIIQGVGDTVATRILTQLMQMQQQIMELEAEKQAETGRQVKLSKPKVEMVG